MAESSGREYLVSLHTHQDVGQGLACHMQRFMHTMQNIQTYQPSSQAREFRAAARLLAKFPSEEVNLAPIHPMQTSKT